MEFLFDAKYHISNMLSGLENNGHSGNFPSGVKTHVFRTHTEHRQVWCRTLRKVGLRQSSISQLLDSRGGGGATFAVVSFCLLSFQLCTASDIDIRFLAVPHRTLTYVDVS